MHVLCTYCVLSSCTRFRGLCISLHILNRSAINRWYGAEIVRGHRTKTIRYQDILGGCEEGGE
jgi:hypothetical protein